MAITKQLRELYHGDPLLMEVIAGLQETIATDGNKKTRAGCRGVGERSLSNGDPLLQESLRHQQQGQDQSEALELARCLRRDKYTSLFSPYRDLVFDPILEEYVIPDEQKLLAMLNKAEPKKCGVEMQEGLLKRGKNESLFSPHSEAMYDPILHEYTLPSESMAQLKALQDDIIMKHKLFSEMKMRRSRNLENNGVHCDPLVHVYRITAVLVSQSKCAIPSEVKSSPTALSTGEFSVYRKPHCGDDLMKASDDYHKKMYW